MAEIRIGLLDRARYHQERGAVLAVSARWMRGRTANDAKPSGYHKVEVADWQDKSAKAYRLASQYRDAANALTEEGAYVY